MKSLACTGLLLPVCLLAAPVKRCEDLGATPFGSDVKIESAKLVAATSQRPEHCDVRGVIWPENHFAVKLPTNWNERFQMVGNGGWAGVISFGPMDAAVKEGYATASTDTGHDEKKDPGAEFAYQSPNNPTAARKLVDFGYLGVHETALLAKKMIRAWYGSDPKYSYWVGCSTGGRQGLMEAQRYPEDFDGYVVGAPVLFLTGLQMRAVWNEQAIGPGPGQIKSEKLPTLAKAVYDKCDAIDGLKDGLIENPLRCNFDPAKDLPRCAGDTDAPACFTGAQIEGLKKVYDGARDSQGHQLFFGAVKGSEAFASAGRGGAPRSGWETILGGMRLTDTFMKYMAFDPPAGPDWNYRQFNFDTDVQRMASTALRINATIPDLSAVKMRGGKILHYHGWADPGTPPTMSVDFYESVNKAMGPTDDFYRFFPVPGMGHCGGGPGCGDVDWLSAIVNWVEKGVAPAKMIGAHIEGGKTTRTRPICAYPNEARYVGTGSIDAAENFICVAAATAAKTLRSSN